MKLMFRNCRGNKRLVKEVADEQEAFVAMKEFVKKLNPNYEIHYIRSWGKNPITYDVGSHTEFFLLYK